MKDKKFVYIRNFILIFIFFYSYVLQYIPFILFHANVSDYQGNTGLALLLSTFSSLIVFGIILCMYRNDIRKELGVFFQKFRYNIGIGLACWGAGLLMMFTANLFFIIVFHSEGANNEIIVRSMMHEGPIVMLLNAVFLAPFIEEFVFRKTLKDIISKPVIYIISSFLAFGIAHVYGMASSWMDWLYVIPYGVLGGAFALAYTKTNTVFTSITFHMIHNLLVFMIVIFL